MIDSMIGKTLLHYRILGDLAPLQEHSRYLTLINSMS